LNRVPPSPRFGPHWVTQAALGSPSDEEVAS